MDNTFGDNLKRIRIEKGLSQDELAKLMGFKDRSSITRIEKSHNSASYDTIVKFSQILGVKPSDFFRESPAIVLSDHEKNLVEAYRSQPLLVQEAIDRMLGIRKKTNGDSSTKAI